MRRALRQMRHLRSVHYAPVHGLLSLSISFFDTLSPVSVFVDRGAVTNHFSPFTIAYTFSVCDFIPQMFFLYHLRKQRRVLQLHWFIFGLGFLPPRTLISTVSVSRSRPVSRPSSRRPTPTTSTSFDWTPVSFIGTVFTPTRKTPITRVSSRRPFFVPKPIVPITRSFTFRRRRVENIPVVVGSAAPFSMHRRLRSTLGRHDPRIFSLRSLGTTARVLGSSSSLPLFRIIT